MTHADEHDTVRTACPAVMVQGTASASGKSLVAAALCRIFHQDGLRPVPFKAQNMSNNSYVTADGREMGRAQVVQAYACGLEPDVRMNPVLLKPGSNGSQVVVEGRPAYVMDTDNWQGIKKALRKTVRANYLSLVREYDVAVLEGAGSPAEINLMDDDIVNMGMAAMAEAPVVLVGDIDRGGVFASLVGTVQLFSPADRARVKGFVINKFQGSVDLLKPGLDRLEELTGIPVLGVVPWLDHAIDEEDGVSERFARRADGPVELDICIVRLPHLANYTDFIPLEQVPGTGVRWADTAAGIGRPDLLVLPGTKGTIADLRALKRAGIADAVRAYAADGGTVLGVCGGFQMLGRVVCDPDGIESAAGDEEGFGLLDMETTFHASKHTVRTAGRIEPGCSPLAAALGDTPVHGYEIHMGKSSFGPGARPFTRDADGNVTGAADAAGRVLGTYLHGLFDTAAVTAGLLNGLRRAKGLPALDTAVAERSTALNLDLNRLAAAVRGALDMDAVYRMAGLRTEAE